MKKRLLSLILCTCMIATICPIYAEATVEGEYEEVFLSLEDLGVDLADNDNLLEGYINQQLSMTAEDTETVEEDGLIHITSNACMASWAYEEDVLTESELSLYTELRDAISQVANGTRTSTRFNPSVKLSYSYDELGVTSESSISEIQTALQSASQESFSHIMQCLLVDCPYELYWYDKTAGFRYSLSISTSGSSEIGSVTIEAVSFCVSSAYQGTSETTVNSDKVQAANKAISNILSIVEKYADLPDGEKINAYKEEICDLTEYNFDVASDSTVEYGDPWQLIYVFDGDDSTRVVCEGYSKAFQYLCDLGLEYATCYTVTGYMNNTGHMWNIVKICGRNYLVDVTNSDNGIAGLFMVDATSAESDTTGDVYTFCGISYTYDSDTVNLYTTQVLRLSTASDDYTHTYSQCAEITAPTCTAQGYTAYTCTVCGDAYKQDYVAATGHSYDDGTVTKTATCTTSGTVKYSCTICGSSYTETIPTTSHTYTSVVTVPTCTSKGYTTYTCTDCGDTYKDNYVAATGHTYTSKVTTAATYTKTGVMTYTCTICGDSYTETIARLGLHSGICAIDAFADITSTSAWYYSAVDYVYHNKIMSGTVAGTGNNDGTFNYSGTVTRAQAVQILYAQAGSPSVAGLENPFTDVKTSDWYYKAVVWAYNNGVTSGTSATTFSPNSEVTREQIICFLYNYTTQVLGRDVSKDATNDLSAYSDASSVSSWARTAVKWSVGNSIVTGTSSTTLSPQATANRATAAQILYTYRINYLGLEIE